MVAPKCERKTCNLRVVLFRPAFALLRLIKNPYHKIQNTNSPQDLLQKKRKEKSNTRLPKNGKGQLPRIPPSPGDVFLVGEGGGGKGVALPAALIGGEAGRGRLRLSRLLPVGRRKVSLISGYRGH